MAVSRIAAITVGIAFTLGGSTIGTIATALAEPQEWDTEAYDACIARGTNARLCCSLSGGYWTKSIESPPNTCVARPTSNTTQAPGNVPTQTLTTEPPPVMSPGSVPPPVTLEPVG